jgi:hypothetical protein
MCRIPRGKFMSVSEKRRGNLVPIHADNVNSKDWLILLEAVTIVGHQRDKLRVALTTKERKLVKKVEVVPKV